MRDTHTEFHIKYKVEWEFRDENLHKKRVTNRVLGDLYSENHHTLSYECSYNPSGESYLTFTQWFIDYSQRKIQSIRQSVNCYEVL